MYKTVKTFFVLFPVTEEAHSWIDHNVDYEDWQRIKGGIVIEHRYFEDIVEAMMDAGLVLEEDFFVY